MARDPKRILLYRLGSLGDHMVAIPAYRQVARAFPGAEKRLLTNIPIAAKAAAAEAVLDGSGLIDSFLTYVVGERNPFALLKLILRIRRYHPDALVYLAGARGIKAAKRDCIFFRLCGITRQIGLPLTEDLQKNRSLGTDPGGTPRFEHEADRLARCIAELGDPDTADPANWLPNLTPAEHTDASLLLAPLDRMPFFAFSIGTKAQANHWTLDNWSAFFASLATEYPGHALVLLGAPDEGSASDEVAAAWRSIPHSGPALNLCGACSPRVSAAVMERSRMYFGHDSGPAHLAASVGTPVLGIYAARNPPGQWFPHGGHVRVLMHWVSCGGCRLETCTVERKRCILSITVPEALAATRELLTQSRHQSTR